MTLRDRGTIKWTSLMLPEHVKQIRNYFAEDDYVAKPQLDEQQLELLNERIAEALEYGSEIIVRYYERHEIHSFACTIPHADLHTRKLHVVGLNGEIRYLALDNIIECK